jgi:hypothetical protein
MQHYTRAVVTSSELLTKEAIRKNCVIYKKIHTYFKVLLSIVTAGIAVLVILGNKILYACVKEVCHLLAQPHFDPFHQLIIVQVL